MQAIEHQIDAHIAAQPAQLVDILKDKFKDDHIVSISDLIPPDLNQKIRKEAKHLLSTEAKRRDLNIASTGNTPRHYSSVGRDQIKDGGTYIPAVFESDAILEFLSKIAGEPLNRVPYVPEEYIINSQNKAGDTHGWHWDDYTYALIWLVEAPGPFSGGRVEYVTKTQWDKENPEETVGNILRENEIRSAYIPSGTCYLMKANTTLHRVSPLSGEDSRTVIVYTFASEADMTDTTITHDTMEAIYEPELMAV